MAKKKEIVFVVYPGFNLLELVGAQHVLYSAVMMSGYKIRVLAASQDPVETDTPMRYVPQGTFADAPHPDGVIVVGGGEAALQALEDAGLLAYLRSAVETAEFAAGLDTGALLLARAGLMQGCQATTHWAYAGDLETLGAHYQRRPYVIDGKFFTGAGVSGSIDLMLALGAHLAGEKNARNAQIYAEYDPQPPFGNIDWDQVRAPTEELRQPIPPSNGPRKQVAMIIYPQLTLFDLIGPLGVFSAYNRLGGPYDIYVVAEQPDPITSDAGLTVIPNKTFAELPHPDILIIPGGGEATLRAMADPALRKYVRQAAASAEMIGSVCTGALILGGIGLLDGQPATTHWAYSEVLNRLGAQYQHQRWVHQGKIINSAGVAAGIDSSLYMLSRLAGEATARKVQLAMQYDPYPPFGGIDWQHLGLFFRLLRGLTSLRAPGLARRAQQLSSRGL